MTTVQKEKIARRKLSLRGTGQASPAEQASNAAPVQERHVIEHAPTIKQQDGSHVPTRGVGSAAKRPHQHHQDVRGSFDAS